MLPLKHILFHSTKITAVKTLVFGWCLESRERKGGFSRRGGISIVSRKLLKYVYVCVSFLSISHTFSKLCFPPLIFPPFLPRQLIANVNRWDPPNVRNVIRQWLHRKNGGVLCKGQIKVFPNSVQKAKAELFILLFFSFKWQILT